jgi:hypothetical protein
MGPVAAKSYRGEKVVESSTDGVARAKQEIDYGRRDKGYIFGAFQPATGEALTAPYDGRSAKNFADFLEKVEAWIPGKHQRVYAIMDNLSAHRANDVLLFDLAEYEGPGEVPLVSEQLVHHL